MRRMVAPGLLLAGLGLAGCAQEPQRVVVLQPAAPVVVRPSCDTSFRVVNASSLTVGTLQFSHSSLNGWGADQLGQAVLPPGRSVSFRAANTGNYDFRVVWTNGRATELRGVNVCAASQITVTNAGLRAS